MRKVLLTLALTVAAMFGMAAPALAHNVLVSADPAKGSSVEVGPDRITLTFDAPVQPGDVNQVAVTGPAGDQWAEGEIRVDSNVVTAPLRPLGPAGEYTVGYRILSADGHPVADKYTFTLTKAGNGTPAQAKAAGSPAGEQAAGEQGGSGGVPIWVWIAGAVVLLGAGLTLALRMGKESTK
ncbi:copper resistance CopC family protein [Amycolatopsis nigrescens]|uniref:copper resistance CopC family protein n=1 Tax=Amycolatopsis nigrescens TaxID=381445 RepID=UPI00037D1D9B|nr:copper resistance CopC family protein [Amycolatopsis nigrescens]